MCEKLKNMTIDDAIVYIDNYLNMVTGKKFDDKKLEELNVFSEIHKQFNRINCAKIGIEGIKSILLEIKNK
jgi:nitrogen fixation NifU-like protein